MRNFIAVRRLLTTLITFLAMSVSLQVLANPLKDIPSGKYDVDLTHASVIWKVSHLGFSTYVGRFNQFDADLMLDAEKFTDSSVNVVIQVDSLDTDFPFTDEEDFNKKLSEDWFKSGEFATITFKSDKVTALDADNNFKVMGDLTLMGETHPVTLDARLNAAAPKHPFKQVPIIGFSATTTIDRTKWGLSNYAPNIGAKVKIEIEGEFLKETK